MSGTFEVRVSGAVMGWITRTLDADPGVESAEISAALATTSKVGAGKGYYVPVQLSAPAIALLYRITNACIEASGKTRQTAELQAARTMARRCRLAYHDLTGEAIPRG